MRKDWPAYFNATKDHKPRPLLVEAMTFIGKRDAALDLGAGALNETEYLFEQGFNRVVAVDAEPKFLDFCKELGSDKLTCIVSTFDEFNFPVDEYDLVNAQFALPFNSPSTFAEVFARIKSSLKKGGIFTGQFFGVNDSWAKGNSDMTFHTKAEVEKFLADMEIVKLEEVEKDDKTAAGDMKHWHVFHVIARKI